jgi:hypothetical protein
MGTTSGIMLTYDAYTTLQQYMMTTSMPQRANVMLCYMRSRMTNPVLMMIIIMVMMRCLTLIVLLAQIKHMPPTFVPILVPNQHQIKITCPLISGLA